MHVIIMMLTMVVELLRRAKENFASSLPFATMKFPFQPSTSRIPTRHPPQLQKHTSSMLTIYYSMFALPIGQIFGFLERLQDLHG